MEIFRVRDGADDLMMYEEDWKTEAVGLGGPEGLELFDETYVMTGNPLYHSHAKASWWKRMKEVVDDGEPVELSDDNARRLNEILKNPWGPQFSENQLAEIASIVSGKEIKYKVIRGYTQGEWQYVYYDAAHGNADYLEAVYFNKMKTIEWESQCVCVYVTDDEFWEAERDGTVKELIQNLFDIGDEPFEVYQVDGYVQVPNWKQIV